MAKLLDEIIVIDVESTCWEGWPPPGQISEIIEVGVCTVDIATLQRRNRRSILIRPQRSEVSAFCTQLTTLTAEDLADAGTLDGAATILRREYTSKDRLWASWGDYDRRQFHRVCDALGVAYPFGVSHLNIKTLFAVASAHEHEPALDEACAQLGLAFEGTHHRGSDDAWNAAAVLCWLLRTQRAGARHGRDE